MIVHVGSSNYGRRASITPHAHSRGKMIWESSPESILIIRKLDYDTTEPFIEVRGTQTKRNTIFDKEG